MVLRRALRSCSRLFPFYKLLYVLFNNCVFGNSNHRKICWQILRTRCFEILVCETPNKEKQQKQDFSEYRYVRKKSPLPHTQRCMWCWCGSSTIHFLGAHLSLRVGKLPPHGRAKKKPLFAKLIFLLVWCHASRKKIGFRVWGNFSKLEYFCKIL